MTSIAVCDWLSRRALVLMGIVVFVFSRSTGEIIGVSAAAEAR